MKHAKNVIGILGIAATSLLTACGQGAEGDGAVGRSTSSSEALGTVNDCITQAQSCAASASSVSQGQACEQQLRACLTTLLPDASLLTAFDAAIPPLPPLPPVFDAAAFTLPDAAVPSFPVPDAGQLVTSVQACLDALGVCLSSGTSPTTCATQVQACIQQAI